MDSSFGNIDLPFSRRDVYHDLCFGFERFRNCHNHSNRDLFKLTGIRRRDDHRNLHRNGDIGASPRDFLDVEVPRCLLDHRNQYSRRCRYWNLHRGAK
jgi:hypothetical protein